jgi:RNA polymerase sigma factor (sigma-70 family)
MPTSDTCNTDTADLWWPAFVRNYSPALLHIAKQNSNSYDDKMDRYAYILDRLRSDNYRRLRQFDEDGKGQLITWLYVVAQRMCIDHQRQRYGRRKSPEHESTVRELEWAARRRLADLLVEELAPNVLPDEESPSPDAQLYADETHRVLTDAVAALEPDERLLVTLRFADGLPVREVTRIIGGRSTFQVYRQLKAVLNGLRTTLEKRGITSP